MRVSQEVLSVLDRAEIGGNRLSLAPLGQLDRKLYEATNKVLVAAGGKWNRKAGAHLFTGDAADVIESIILTGEIVSIKQVLQQFYTPAAVVARVIEEARIERGMSLLEPSAGFGALALPAVLLGALVDCVEIDPKNAEMLKAIAGSVVLTGDFMDVDYDPEIDERYDRVIMNPPFTKGQDVRHVLHAAKFLKPGGRLVAVMSASILHRETQLYRDFRVFLDLHHATVVDLPADSFKASGTSVNTILVSFDMPEVI